MGASHISRWKLQPKYSRRRYWYTILYIYFYTVFDRKPKRNYAVFSFGYRESLGRNRSSKLKKQYMFSSAIANANVLQSCDSHTVNRKKKEPSQTGNNYYFVR